MTNTFDLKKARQDTRACENIIHFNNAGSSLMPAPVADYLHEFLNQEERIGGYETVEAQQQALDNFYQATAKLLNCDADEVAFVENATRAWDMAFYSFKFSAGDRILTTISEYGSNVIAYNQRAREQGVEVVFVPNDEWGQIDVDALRELIDDRVKLVSISLIPTGGGLVNPAREVGQVTREANIPFLLDACQGVGHLPLDVEQIGCDILSGTGRKYLRGPRGTGLLYVKKDLIEKLVPPFLDQHAADLISPQQYTILPNAKRFENWEQFFAGKAALGVAIDYALDIGLDTIKHRVYALADQIRTGLERIEGVTVEDEGVEKCGIVTFRSDRIAADVIKQKLKENKINVTVSDGSGSLVSFQQRGIQQLVRASVHYFNTEQEVEYFLEIMENLSR